VCSQTAENECKWGGTEGGGQGKFDFSSCDKIRDFATANNAT
jgi:GH35 family endo-1,4-beta-xylanase